MDLFAVITAIRLVNPINAVAAVNNNMGSYPNLSEMLPANAGAIADPQTAPKATMEDIKPKFTLPINSAVMTGLIIDINPCGPP